VFNKFGRGTTYQKMTTGMVIRAREYGILPEIEKFARKLGLENYIVLPEEFKTAHTILQANLYAQKVLGMTADYTGCDIAVANEWNRGVYEAFRDFPKLRDDIQYVGEMHAWQNKAYYNHFYSEIEKINPSWESEKIEQGANFLLNIFNQEHPIGNSFGLSLFAKEDALKSFNGIFFNSMYAHNRAVFEKALKDADIPEWHKTIKSVIDHEIGHGLNKLLQISTSDDIVEIHKRFTEEQIAKQVSVNAIENDSELVAEAWAEYRNSPKPSVIATFIGKAIIARYKKL
jgi:hypothetical protein